RYLADAQVSQAVVGYLKAVGVNADLKYYEWGNYVNMYFKHQLGPIFLIGSASAALDAADALENVSCGVWDSWYCNSGIQALLVIVGISAVAFALTHVIGDPVVLLLPFQANPAQVAVMRHALGLDQPLFVQYLTFLRASLHGDFGISIRQETPALALVLDRVPATAELASAALVIAVGTAVPLGVAAALRRRTIVDRAALLFSMLGQSMPTFWLGPYAIRLFGAVLW